MAPLPLQLALYFAYLLAPHTYLPFQPTASLTKDMNCRFAEETTGSTTATATTRVASCHRCFEKRILIIDEEDGCSLFLVPPGQTL